MTENFGAPKVRDRQRTVHPPKEAIKPAVQVQTPQQAHRLLNDAAILRDDAEQYGWAVERFGDADSMEAAALAYLYPEPDQSIVPDQGELVPLTGKPARRRSAKVSALADNERLALTSEARADELAIDMEESVTAQTSIEKAMVHHWRLHMRWRFGWRVGPIWRSKEWAASTGKGNARRWSRSLASRMRPRG